MISSAKLANARNLAETVMADDITVSRPVDTADQIIDPATLAATPPVLIASVNTTGKGGRSLAGPAGLGMMATAHPAANIDRIAELSASVEVLILSTPHDAPALLAGDVVRWLAAPTDEMADAAARVVRPIRRSFHVRRTYVVEILTPAAR